MKNKIRFIDSKYNTLFYIPDGGSICVILNDGEQITRKCRYIDDYHFNVGGRTFHIAEYAEIMERNGNKYEPASIKTMETNKRVHKNEEIER